MKAAFRQFFTNAIARAAAFLAVLIVLIVAAELAYVYLISEWDPNLFSLLVLPYAIILLLLAVVIEYLSRIANAMERAAGVEHDLERWW
jgi:CBS domain containing-hemolysin-like protein